MQYRVPICRHNFVHCLHGHPCIKWPSFPIDRREQIGLSRKGVFWNIFSRPCCTVLYCILYLTSIATTSWDRKAYIFHSHHHFFFFRKVISGPVTFWQQHQKLFMHAPLPIYMGKRVWYYVVGRKGSRREPWFVISRCRNFENLILCYCAVLYHATKLNSQRLFNPPPSYSYSYSIWCQQQKKDWLNEIWAGNRKNTYRMQRITGWTKLGLFDIPMLQINRKLYLPLVFAIIWYKWYTLYVMYSTKFENAVFSSSEREG